MKRWMAWLTVTVLAVSSMPAGGTAPVAAVEPKREIRAFWVDAFHDGFKTREQVDQLMRDVRRSKANTVIVQVRRRGMLISTRLWNPARKIPL